MASERRIREFWQWFRSVCSQFGEHLDNRHLLDELDARVAKLGPFSWEVGPGYMDDHKSSLVLTPSGDSGLLVQTRKVIGVAPDCDGWELYAAKPPKRWQRQFLLRDKDGRDIPVDASGSRYVLFGYPDGVFDVLLADPRMAGLPESLRQTAAEVLLDGELGEEQRMALVHEVEVLAQFDDKTMAKSNPIEVLASHLKSVRHSREHNA